MKSKVFAGLIAFALLVGVGIMSAPAASADPGPCRDNNPATPCTDPCRDNNPTTVCARPTVTVPAQVVTNTIVVQCEGPTTTGVLYGAYSNFNGGFYVPNYGGVYGWTQPMLVTRSNGVVVQALPNTYQCTPPAPVVQTQVVTVPAATAVPAPVTAPTVAAVAPAAPVAPVIIYRTIKAPNTGDGGLLPQE